jgi:hypothetical protein
MQLKLAKVPVLRAQSLTLGQRVDTLIAVVLGGFIVNRFLSGGALAIVLIGSALTSSIHANASTYTYDFSYTFFSTNSAYNGAVMSGSFTGTPSGGNVIDISNISAFFNGTSIGSPLYAYSYTGPAGGPNCPTCFALGGAVASSNPLDNNFLFSTASSVNALLSLNSTWFYIIQPWNNGTGNYIAVQYYVPPNFYVDLYNGEYTGNFSLTQTPLPPTWMMLIAALAGLGFFAYRGNHRSAALAAA